MDDAVVIFISVVTVISLIIAILLFVLFIQRRRQRALLMLSIAQEEAERRRRKRKKAGLRSAEIDAACPQAIVSAITQPPVGLAVYTLDTHPTEYQTAITDLRAKGLLPATDAHLSVVSAPPLAASDEARSVDVGDFTAGVPKVVISLPVAMETCVICLEDVVVGSRVRSLPCSHVYHAQCIRVWLRRKNACPCCCVKVIKRRKKRARTLGETATATEETPAPIAASEEPAMESPMLASAVRAVSDNTLTSRHDVGVSVRDRPADRDEHTIIDVMEPRSKSMNLGVDRQRWPGGPPRICESLPRNASLVDPQDPTSEVIMSDASSHVDDSSRTALMSEVRLALHGGSSLLSVNTSVDEMSDVEFLRVGSAAKKCEVDEDSFPKSSGLGDADLENVVAKRQGKSDVVTDV